MKKRTYKQRGRVMKMNRFQNSIVAVLAAVGLMFQGAVPVALAAKTDKPSIEVEKVRVPEIYGTIKEVHKGNDQVIFYLQDAHANIEAQRNNARILEDLIGTYGVDTVAVEGAEGRVNRDKLAQNPDRDSVQEAASYFLNLGRLSGAEYLAITGDTRFELLGLEDKKIYDKNTQALLAVMPSQEASVAHATAIKGALDQIGSKVYPAELKAFIDRAMEYRAGDIRFTEYAQMMRDMADKHGIDISEYKNFGLQGKSFAMEGTIDFDAVEDERAAIVDEVSKKLSKEDTSNLVVQSLSFRLGRLSAVEYYDILKEHCKKSEVDLTGKKNLSSYIDYINVFEGIDKDSLVDEAYAIERSIKDKMFVNDDQRKLDKLVQWTEMLGKMFQVKLGIREHKVYAKDFRDISIPAIMDFIKTHGSAHGVEAPKMDIAAFEKNQVGIESFYNIAVERDEVLFKNAVSIMKEKKLDRMAMVTGGFHTAAVVAKLKKEGFSLVVLTPRITDFDVKSPYLDIIGGEKTPFEKAWVFAEDQTLAPWMEGSGNTEVEARAALVGDIDANGFSERTSGGTTYIGLRTERLPTGARELTAGGVTANDIGGGITVVKIPSSADVAAVRVALLRAPSAGPQAKAIGPTADQAKLRDVDAAIAASTTDVTTQVVAMQLGTEIADALAAVGAGRTIQFVEVDNAALMSADGKTFDMGTTRAHMQIHVASGTLVKVGVPKGLLDSIDAIDKENMRLAAIKEPYKGDVYMANYADLIDTTGRVTAAEKAAIKKAADIRGLSQEVTIGGAGLVTRDLQHYIDKFVDTTDISYLARFVAMASSALTQAAKDKATAARDAGKMTPEEMVWDHVFADQTQERVRSLLLLAAKNHPTIITALTTMRDHAASIPDVTPEEQRGAQAAAKDLLASRDLGSNPQARAKEAGYDFNKGVIVTNDPDPADTTQRLTIALTPDQLAGVTPHHTDGYTSKVADADLQQALRENARVRELSVNERAMIEHAIAKFRAGDEITVDSTYFGERVVVNGKATQVIPKTAFAIAFMAEMATKGVRVNVVDEDLADNAALEFFLGDGVGMDVSALTTAGALKVFGGRSAAQVDVDLDTELGAARAAVNKRYWALKAADLRVARDLATKGYRAYAGDTNVSLGQILLILSESDPTTLADILRQAGAYNAEIAGILAEAGKLPAAVGSLQLIPAIKSTESVFTDMRDDRRDPLAVAA